MQPHNFGPTHLQYLSYSAKMRQKSEKRNLGEDKTVGLSGKAIYRNLTACAKFNFILTIIFKFARVQ